MSSPLRRLTLGRRPVHDQDRAVMLSRLGIAEEKPRDLFREEPPAPTAEPTPEAWRQPANDEHLAPARIEEPAPAPAPAKEEDPFEAIRRQYRNSPTLPRIPARLQPKARTKPKAKARSKRRQTDMARTRKLIWGLAWASALFVAWALLTGDASHPVVQVFGMLLP